MEILRNIVLVLLSSISILTLATDIVSKKVHYTTTVEYQSCLYNEYKITAYTDNKEMIGYIYYRSLPFSFFIIHSFFIIPACRKQGYGSGLLQHTQEQIGKNKACILFIQPGPFEYSGKEPIELSLQEYQERIKYLLAYYKKHGFYKVPVVMQYCAITLYKMIGINEDGHYLMIKKI